ncbi:digestive cysteine proteinase 1-like [Physella acuta]|uniref:digestive cysteine proteinase 1-like n=1 Tax=Physella acuta TaxID=109671 RepID=UPI0027DB332D|nr:digestive cysteine proteinase 1-like [Physella acuta]XP_059155053.1 digestive cysteine proteinase 1-like [Physella acuta]
MANLGYIPLVFFFVGCLAVDPPVYKDTYRVEGVMRFPYPEITEPFVAFFDAPNSRSRVDYYNGTQRTIQFSEAPGLPYGTSFLVVPVTNLKVYNQIKCFQVSGIPDALISLSSVLPDLTDYVFVGKEMIGTRLANKYQKSSPVEGRNNKFWADAADLSPIRFEQFDIDKYYVDFTKWESPAVFTDKDFAVPDNLTCTALSNTNPEQHIMMNPIREYIHNYDDHVHEAFERFKKTHNKAYKDDEEHETRKQIFRKNLRFINSKNRAGLTYTLAVNHLADRSQKEMKVMRGFRYTHGDHGGKKFSLMAMDKQDVPDQWDWRLQGAVTPVKDQASCGSCWSFSATGAMEGAYFLKNGHLERLSEQQLVDCSWGFANTGCDGGFQRAAFEYTMQNGGIASEEQYGHYLAIDGFCRSRVVQPVVQLANYTDLPEGDLGALKLAIFNKGPVSVSIDASQDSFTFYANGVYYEPNCKKRPKDLDHSVLAVGYGTMNGQDYWLVKNSWSTYWGNDGYILMSQKDNNCGVASDAVFVNVK